MINYATASPAPHRIKIPIIGNSTAIVQLRDMVAMVAKSPAPVMICGPAGSGKELIARAIHGGGYDQNTAFLKLSGPSAMSDIQSATLLHQMRRSGGGTLYFQQIEDIPFDLQYKLARILGNRHNPHRNGNMDLPSNLRIISSCTPGMAQAVADRQFNENLFYQLGGITLHIPGLCSRAEDIAYLIAHFQSGKSREHIARFDDRAMNRLMAHDWPGNVRELRNLVERADMLFGGRVIGPEYVGRLLVKNLDRNKHQMVPNPMAHIPNASIFPQIPVDLRNMVETIEQTHIETALEQCSGIISQAARLLSLKRTTLVEKMRKYGVERAA